MNSVVIYRKRKKYGSPTYGLRGTRKKNMAPSRGTNPQKKQDDTRTRTKKFVHADSDTEEKEATEQGGQKSSKIGKHKGIFEHEGVCGVNKENRPGETELEKGLRLLDEEFYERLRKKERAFE